MNTLINEITAKDFHPASLYPETDTAEAKAKRDKAKRFKAKRDEAKTFLGFWVSAS